MAGAQFLLGWVLILGNTYAALGQKNLVIIAAAGGGGLTLLGVATMVFFYCRRKRRISKEDDGPAPSAVDNVSMSSIPATVTETNEVGQPQDTDLESTVQLDVPDYATIGALENSKNNVNESNAREDDASLASVKLELNETAEISTFPIENNIVDQPDALYAAIKTDKGRKITVKYNKTTVESVLYVPAKQDNPNSVEESLYDIEKNEF